MKLKIFYKLFGLALLFVVLQSRSSGPGNAANLQVTGAPGSVGTEGTCANVGCHSSGAFDPSLSIDLLDGDGTAVETYEPGSSYTLRIVTQAGSGSPARYGFQAVSLDASDAQAGSWGDIGTGKQVVNLSARDYLEQSSPSQDGTFEMEWIAPEAGTGSVTFYTASAAVNNNGGTSGDGTAAGSLELSEATSSNTFDLSDGIASFQVMPNPVGEQFTLEVNSLTSGDFTVSIIGLNGATLRSEKISLTNGINREVFQVADLASGLYILQLEGESQAAAARLLKK